MQYAILCQSDEQGECWVVRVKFSDWSANYTVNYTPEEKFVFPTLGEAMARKFQMEALWPEAIYQLFEI